MAQIRALWVGLSDLIYRCCAGELHEGDTLIVSELSRLGRSMLECMEILSIATQKGINVYAIKGTWRLDGTLQSRIVAMATLLRMPSGNRLSRPPACPMRCFR